MPRVMYFDCFSGAAGDMILGALLDAGLPLDALSDALGSLRVDHALKVTRVVRAGLSATHLQVLGAEEPDAHLHRHGDHDHSHGDAHVHRSLKDISHLIGHSSLSDAAKARARAMFHRLGEAEAAIHQMPLDRVHLHEVGALDSIIDIAGAAFALEWFGIDDIVSSPLNVGGGTVEIAHGRYPVPAPATLRLLEGIPVYSSDIKHELVTPTGALLLSTYSTSFGAMPPMTVQHVGYGAGTRDLPGVPNVLRVVIGERLPASQSRPGSIAAGGPGAQDDGQERVLKIECEIDDMTPQLFGPVSESLFAAGALDVFLTPVYMKKGRPGTLLTILSPEPLRETICALLFRETTTIGVRFERVEREVLERESLEVALPGGTVRMKVARRRGEIVNVAPEFDDCVRLARATGRPIKEIQADAVRAYAASGHGSGRPR